MRYAITFTFLLLHCVYYLYCIKRLLFIFLNSHYTIHVYKSTIYNVYKLKFLMSLSFLSNENHYYKVLFAQILKYTLCLSSVVDDKRPKIFYIRLKILCTKKLSFNYLFRLFRYLKKLYPNRWLFAHLNAQWLNLQVDNINEYLNVAPPLKNYKSSVLFNDFLSEDIFKLVNIKFQQKFYKF